MIPDAVKQRFAGSYVSEPNSGCWIWTGTTIICGHKKSRQRRAAIRHKGKVYLASRVSWEIHRGPIADDIFALHRCDNPMCVNPEHLFLGDQQANVSDCIAKGRRNTARGERCRSAILTADIVTNIRQSDKTGAALALEHNISQAQISRVRSGRHWKHIK